MTKPVIFVDGGIAWAVAGDATIIDLDWEGSDQWWLALTRKRLVKVRKQHGSEVGGYDLDGLLADLDELIEEDADE